MAKTGLIPWSGKTAGKTVEVLTSRLGLSHGTVEWGLSDGLIMNKVSARWMQCMLDADREEKTHLNISHSILARNTTNLLDIMNRIATVDEHWISLFNPEMKRGIRNNANTGNFYC